MDDLIHTRYPEALGLRLIQNGRLMALISFPGFALGKLGHLLRPCFQM
jgi:hypothetical protein